MARQIKVPFSLETTKAIRDARRLTGELKNAEGAAQSAGDKGTESFDKMGVSVTSAFGAIGAGVGVVAGAIAVLDQINSRFERINATRLAALDIDRQRQAAGAQQLAAPGIRALAGIRGQAELETQREVIRTAAQFDVGPEEARAAAFGIESSRIFTELGPQAARDITADALMVARVSGATGATVGGLATTGFEAGLTTREGIRQFLAMAELAARGSRVTLQELGRVMQEVVPLAITAGIPLDRFMAIAAQMSFRIGSAEQLRTALRQMIGSARVPSQALERVAREAGVDLSTASTTDILALQSEFVLGAQGQQEIGRRVTALGLGREIADVLLATQDPVSRAAAKQAAVRVAGATFQGDIAGRFGQVTTTREAVQRRTAAGAELAGLDFGAPGTAQEATGLLGVFINEQRARQGFTGEALALGANIAEAQFLDEGLTPQQAEKLLALNRITDTRLIPALNVVTQTIRPSLSAIGIRFNIARRLKGELLAAQRDANGVEFFGTPESQLIAFEVKVTEVIEFLRELQTGTVEPLRPTGEEFIRIPSTVGGALTEGIGPILEPGVLSEDGGLGPQSSNVNNIGVIYVNQPGTRALNDLTRANEARLNV